MFILACDVHRVLCNAAEHIEAFVFILSRRLCLTESILMFPRVSFIQLKRFSLYDMFEKASSSLTEKVLCLVQASLT